jgi:hypothetical protein
VQRLGLVHQPADDRLRVGAVVADEATMVPFGPRTSARPWILPSTPLREKSRAFQPISVGLGVGIVHLTRQSHAGSGSFAPMRGRRQEEGIGSRE